MADPNVLAGACGIPSFLVASRFQADGVVAHVQMAVLNQDPAAPVRVDAIVIRPMSHHGDATNGQILAPDRVNVPGGPVLHRDPFQQDPAAMDELNEIGPDTVFFPAEDALLHRRSRPPHFHQPGHAGLLVLPGPPRLALAVQSTLAGDGHVFAVPSIGEGGVVVAPDAAPLLEDDGQVIFVPCAEADFGPFLKVKFNPALEVNRPGHPDPRGDNQASSPALMQLVNSLRECRSAIAAGFGQTDLAVRDPGQRRLDITGDYRCMQHE